MLSPKECESVSRALSSRLMALGLYCLVFLLWIGFTSATVVMTTPSNTSLPFSDEEASFTPRVPQTGVVGLLSLSNPRNACEPLRNGPVLEKSPFSTFVLVERGVCHFDVKVRHAQNAGFSAVIVYSNEDSAELVTMAGDSFMIRIPAVYVSKGAGEVLAKYAGDLNTRCYIFPTLDYPAWSVMAVAFISLVAIILILAVFFFVRRNRLRRLGSRLLLHRDPPGLTSSEVKALPTLIFKRDQYANNETCVICMEEYENDQKLRLLPCRHAFHASCIDQWLLTRKPFCPVCKRDAHAKADGTSTTENTPLLTSRYPTPPQQTVSSAPVATQTSPTGTPRRSCPLAVPLLDPSPALHRSSSLVDCPPVYSPPDRTSTRLTSSSWPQTHSDLHC